MNKYIVIPHLVSIESELTKINDFLMSQNLNFYSKKSMGDCQLNYKITFSSSIIIPKTFDFRNGDYIIKENTIYYQRKLLPNVGFIFSYNLNNKTFCFNKIYKYHFVNIGDILTMGRHIFHVIEYDLLMQSKFILLSAGVVAKQGSMLLLSPNMTGKTTYIANILKNTSSRYLSENFTVIDTKHSDLYGISPIFKNKGRKSNNDLEEIFAHKRIPIVGKSKINRIYLYSYGFKNKSNKKLSDNYVSAFSGYFRKNNLLRTIIYYQQQSSYVDKQYKVLTEFLAKKVIITSDMNLIYYGE